MVWYNRKWFIILLHALSWAVIFSLPFFLRTQFNSQHNSQPQDPNYIYFYIISSIVWVAFFYLNAYTLLPKLAFRKKYRQYILSLVLAVATVYFIHRLGFYLLITMFPFVTMNFFLFNIFPFLFILASSTAYRMVLDKISTDKLMQEKENAQLKTELSFLRSQVSPHFMFNVLNNMVALARKKSDALEPSLIKLSSLMRYMLYETGDEKVPLEKEIEYLQSYIDLQQQRFGNNVTIIRCFKDVESGHDIEPMLLIPFVENAFKHGTGFIENAAIEIKLKMADYQLEFTVRNKYNDGPEIKDKTSGIGLNNVERRLNLLYAQKHSLSIAKEDSWFTVTLKIQLN